MTFSFATSNLDLVSSCREQVWNKSSHHCALYVSFLSLFYDAI